MVCGALGDLPRMQFATLGMPCSYTTAGAGTMATRGELRGGVDVLIVDPPRKGLDEEVLQALTRWVGPSVDVPCVDAAVCASSGVVVPFAAPQRSVHHTVQRWWSWWFIFCCR